MEIHPTEMRAQLLLQRLTSFASNIREGAQKTKSFSSTSSYRVPKGLRRQNEIAYTPRLIAIGPLHRNDEHLQTPMQHVKLSYTNNLLCRMTQGMENQEAEQKKILQECVAAMEMSIEDAKKCYAEETTLDSEMMLIDGCFILEFFYRFLSYRYGIHSEPMALEDPIFANDMTIQSVQQDLLLLENQIPFLVLQRLFPLTLARIPNNPLKFSLTDYVFLPQVAYNMRPVEGNSTNRDSAKTSCWPRDCLLWVSGSTMNNFKPEEEVSSHNANCHYHILHKIHDDFLPHHQTGKGRLRQLMPSASELLYAGVKFVKLCK